MKVAIIGGCSKRPHGALAYGPEWEFWGVNACHQKWVPHERWTRWFNLHRYEHLMRDWYDELSGEIYWCLNNPEIPLYVLDSWNGQLPNEIIFPREELRSLPYHDYHAGSFDWLVAFAIHLGAEEIALHGIGLVTEPNEPISARACLEFWCGVACGKGIEIHIADDCDIFLQYHLVKSHSIYGYDDVRLVEDRT